MEKSSIKKRIIILDDMIGSRLDKALSTVEEIHSRSRAEHLIDKGFVLVNGKTQKSSYKVCKNDAIDVLIPKSDDAYLVPLELPLEILFEDNDLIVINKPAGLVVHPAAGHKHDTLVNALIHHTDDLSMKFGENRPGIVHRLDKDTSGVLVIAKNDFTHEALAKQFKEKTTHRIYHALCYGIPATDNDVIQSYLARHPIHRKKNASILGKDKKIIRKKVFNESNFVGKWAVTHFKILKTQSSNLSYLELKLETGRTHQIRVHLSELNLPIVADEIYCSDKKIKNIKDAGIRSLLEKMPRLALHARELGFIHPRSGEKMFFSIDWPEQEKSILKMLGIIP